MFVSQRSREASAKCAIQKSDLDQVRIDDLFDRVLLFLYRSRDGDRDDWSATKFLYERQQQFERHLVETVIIDFHPVQRVIRECLRHASVIFDSRVVAHTT